MCRTRTMKIVMKVGQGECPVRPLVLAAGWGMLGSGEVVGLEEQRSNIQVGRNPPRYLRASMLAVLHIYLLHPQIQMP